MNRSLKNYLNTVDGIVDDIIVELDLRDKVNTTNLSEEDLAVLQAILTRYIGEKHNEWSINDKLYQDCIGYLMMNQWIRLKRHRIF